RESTRSSTSNRPRHNVLAHSTMCMVQNVRPGTPKDESPSHRNRYLEKDMVHQTAARDVVQNRGDQGEEFRRQTFHCRWRGSRSRPQIALIRKHGFDRLAL